MARRDEGADLNNRYAKCYTRAELGCHADGAFGHQHVRDVLASMLLQTARDRRPPSVSLAAVQERAAALRAPMSDDAWEEDEALVILNDACAQGLAFELVDGDLVLLEA